VNPLTVASREESDRVVIELLGEVFAIRPTLTEALS